MDNSISTDYVASDKGTSATLLVFNLDNLSVLGQEIPNILSKNNKPNSKL